MLGREGLAACLLAHDGRPPAEMCRAIFADLTEYRGDAPQFDDMAVMIVGVNE
jgi:serine phosphatase RsbU (regulator of sigma subunit)